MQNPNPGSNDPYQNPPNQNNPYQNPPYQDYPNQGYRYPTQGAPYPQDQNQPYQQGQGVPYQQGQAAPYPPAQGRAAQPVVPPQGTSFTQEEWQTLVHTPLQVSTAMMAIAPSGPIGMVQEAMSIGRSIQTLQQHGSANPLISALSQHVSQTLEAVRSGGPSPLGDVQATLRDPQRARQNALVSCQQTANILRKAAPQDAIVCKQLIYSFALNVAQAAREGGLFGIGGQLVSEPEQAMLRDIASALGFQPS